MGGFDALAAQFDRLDTKRKGDQFEAVCKWFLENDPTYQPLLKRVWLWNDWPGRTDIDAGVDLVAEDHDGKLWAIQAKAYNPAYSISKSDIDSFISESSRVHFSHRLLIGTTDKRNHRATRLMDDLGIPFIGLTQLRETDDLLDWPATPAALSPSKPLKPKNPWDYQKAAITDVVKGFTTADRGQLIMACGTGKTLTAWFIHEKLAAERTLVLVPSLSLLKQTMREWQTANPKKPFATLPVCSDETVGGLGEDAAVSHISDLGVPVTTDPEVIAEFLRKRSGPRVVFSTYQSSPQIAEAFRLGRVPAFDLVVADEAHRVAGPVSSDFGTVLDSDAIKAKRRLFMTATPRYFTGRVLKQAKDADYEVASMDDHTRFGEVFHRLTFSEAIDRDLLTDYQVAIIGVDDATYLDWAQRGALITVDGTKITDARSLAGQIGLAKAMKKFDLRRVISFHSRVKASKDFAASMPAVLDWMPPRQRPKGRLWSQYASGEMSAGERGALIGHLKRLEDGERGLLANARCLSEGVDVPALDGVAFIDPRRSEVDIVQAVGRAIRKSDTKTVGTIVIPVFIDTDEDAEVALDSSVFKPVWDVIKALRAHDTELGEQLDALRREMGRKGGTPQLPGKIHIDVPATVGLAFANAFEARLVDATTASFEYKCGLLERFREREGHTRVPQKHVEGRTKLGVWVVMIRTMGRAGKLSPERRQALEAIDGWSWEPWSENWYYNYELAVQYADREGHCLVPQRHKEDGEALGVWVNSQRTLNRDGNLPADRFKLLDAIPGWAWDAIADQWMRGYTVARKFTDREGHSVVPPHHIEDGVPLGAWMNKQRDRGRKGELSDERRELLEALNGWTWNLLDARWLATYEALKKYAERAGHCVVPKGVVEEGVNIGDWANTQRMMYRKGKLAGDRIQLLESLPGWLWDVAAARWEEYFNRLVQFVNHNGHARVPQNHKSADGLTLGRWVSDQRMYFRAGTLDADRKKRLEDLPGWVWNGRQ